MKSLFSRLLFLLLVPALSLSLAGCGGDHKSQDQNIKPAFDVSGTWPALMDGIYLGQFHFKMASKGDLSGDLDTSRNGKANLAGFVAAYRAEFTIVFSDAAYLASLEFQTDQANASGSLVDNAGRVHSLVLYKQ